MWFPILIPKIWSRFSCLPCYSWHIGTGMAWGWWRSWIEINSHSCCIHILLFLVMCRASRECLVRSQIAHHVPNNTPYFPIILLWPVSLIATLTPPLLTFGSFDWTVPVDYDWKRPEQGQYLTQLPAYKFSSAFNKNAELQWLCYWLLSLWSKTKQNRFCIALHHCMLNELIQFINYRYHPITLLLPWHSDLNHIYLEVNPTVFSVVDFNKTSLPSKIA